MVAGELVIFGQVADAPAHVGGAGRLAEQRGLAVGLLGDAEEDLDERGLARAVLAEQAVDLALLDRERDALERLDAAVVLAELARLDDRHGRLRDEVLGMVTPKDSPIGRGY